MTNESLLRGKIARLNRIAKALDGAYMSAARKFDLAESAFWLLYEIKLSDAPLTQKELCDNLFLPKQSINSALKKLEADGCLTLEYAENSRKRKLIRLTEKGDALAAATASKIVNAELRMLDGMDPAAVDRMLDVYEKYAERIVAELASIAPEEEEKP